ncbi:hypothetical protein [Desulfofalx alkaliphila]|uniref:hypothetical protein n=1 Tax=Desulfofalx alkaliphila TaxID=105483 RepID=UPI0004E17F38|nr:hypothetical protein [Desulfofalx alkaliphila]
MAKEKPILFNTEMVRAILVGRKMQTRRPIDKDISNRFDIDVDGTAFAYIDQTTGDSYKPQDICMYKIGDILWVRETWCVDDLTPDDIYYRANYTDKQAKELFNDIGLKWRPSIHMPRSAARLFLRVTKVRVERLQDITEEDARAEGCPSNLPNAKVWFAGLWDKLFANKLFAKRGYGYANNPWVWVIEFEVVQSC